MRSRALPWAPRQLAFLGRLATHRAAVPLLCCALLTFHLLSLLRFPLPFVDEAWAANRAWALLTTGVAFGELDAGVFEQFPAHSTYFPLLPTMLQALPLWVVGVPTLWPLRLLSLAFGCLLLAASYSIGHSTTDRASGLLTATLTAVSTPFAYSAHLARWDIFVAALGYSALALQLQNGTRSLARAALAGLLIGLAFEVHPHAAVFAPVAVGMYLFESKWRAVLRRDAWAWAGGLAAGAGVYYYCHLAADPASFIALVRLAHGPTHTPALATADPAAIGDAIAKALILVAGVNPFSFIALLVAYPVLVYRSRGAAQMVPILAALVFASFALLVRNRFPYYAILVTPSIDLVSAAALVLVARHRRGFFDLLMGATLLLLLTLGAAVTATLLRVDGSSNFERVLARVVREVRPHDVVIGPQTYWFGLTNRRYLSWEQLVYFRRCYPESTLSEAFQYLKPDVLILDDHLRFFLRDRHASQAYAGRLNIPADEFARYVERHARVLTDFDGEHYGRVTVYRLDADSAASRRDLGSCATRFIK